MMWDGGHYYFGWPGMLLAMVALGGLVAAGGYLAGWWLGRQPATSDPREVLDERLSRGEIDVAEYTRIRQAIADRRPVG